MDFEALAQNYKPIDLNATNARYAPKKPKKGFWQDQISTGGGIAGASAGALAGAGIGSVVPGVGTVIGGLAGAILGGFGGGSAGQYIENGVVGEEDMSKDVLKEGLLNGAFALGPIRGANIALQGGKALVRGAGTSGVKEAVETAATATPIRNAIAGKLSSVGTNLERGVANTTKVADSYTQETGLIDALKRNGLNGSAAKQYQNVDGAISNLNTRIADELATIGTTTPRTNVISNLQKTTSELLPSDATYSKELTRSLERLSKSSEGEVGPQELFAFKKELNSRLSNAFNKMQRGAPLTAKEEVDMALWKNLDNQITTLAPNVKQMTLDQSKLITARPGLQAGGQKTMGVPILGLKSKAAEQTLQSITDRTGRGLKAASGIKLPGSAIGPVRTGLRVGAGDSLVNSLFFPGVGPDMQNEDQIDPSLIEQLSSPTGENTDLADPNAEVEQPTNPFGISRDEVAHQMLLALSNGDRKGYADLKDLYGLISDFEESQDSSKGFNSTTASQLAMSDNGLGTLNQLEQLYSGAGGGQGKLGGIIGSALGKAGMNDNVASYEALANSSVSQLAKAINGGGQVSDADAAVIISALPKVTDSPQVAMTKFAALKQRLQNARQNTMMYNSGARSSGNEDLAALGY